MLLSKETNDNLEEVVEGTVSALTLLLFGREQRVSPVTQAVLAQASVDLSQLTALQQSYVAGKVAAQLGPDRVRRSTTVQLRELIRDLSLVLSDQDQLQLDNLSAQTERALRSVAARWRARVRRSITQADQRWNAILTSRRMATAEARQQARAESKTELIEELDGLTNGVQNDLDTTMQTAMASFFLAASVADADDDVLVFKIPRPTAERHCMRLHLNSDGSPILYRLGDVRGNSNDGVPASAWEFTVGPVHPHCYCVLYQQGQRRVAPSEQRASQRATALRPLTKSVAMECCTSSGEPEDWTRLRRLVKERLTA